MANEIDKHEYRLGRQELDRDHDILIAFVAKLETALEARAHWQTLANLMLELKAYADSHFENEEELMQASDYPNLAEHKAEHERMRQHENQLIESIRAGDKSAAEDLVFLLKKFLNEHIAGPDRLVADYLNHRDAVSQPAPLAS
jgi:hemerythrin-like metal-binding protein